MYQLTRGVLALMIGFIISIIVGVIILPLLRKIKIKKTGLLLIILILLIGAITTLAIYKFSNIQTLK